MIQIEGWNTTLDGSVIISTGQKPKSRPAVLVEKVVIFKMRLVKVKEIWEEDDRGREKEVHRKSLTASFQNFLLCMNDAVRNIFDAQSV